MILRHFSRYNVKLQSCLLLSHVCSSYRAVLEVCSPVCSVTVVPSSLWWILPGRSLLRASLLPSPRFYHTCHTFCIASISLVSPHLSHILHCFHLPGFTTPVTHSALLPSPWFYSTCHTFCIASISQVLPHLSHILHCFHLPGFSTPVTHSALLPSPWFLRTCCIALELVVKHKLVSPSVEIYTTFRCFTYSRDLDINVL